MQHTQEIHQVLNSTEDIAFEPLQSEQNSPLNQAVVASDKEENTPSEVEKEQQPNSEEQDANQNEPSQPEDTDDAPSQQIDQNDTETTHFSDEESVEIPTSHAKQAADTILGITDNVLEVGSGYFVKIRKHKEFYEFEEIVHVIDKQNKKNVKRIKLDKDDKVLLRPILIAVLKKKAKKLTPEQQLMGAVISILMKKAQTVMEIKAENDILTERILDIVKEEKGETAPDNDTETQTQEQHPQQEVVEPSEVEELIAEEESFEEHPAPIIPKGDNDSNTISSNTSPSEASSPDSYRDGGKQGAKNKKL